MKWDRMTESQLVDDIITEMDRVWGEDGFGGEDKEYEWLLENYGISEYEDVKWQLILQKTMNELPEDIDDDPEMIEFLEDEQAVRAFLEEILAKYKSSSAVYSEHKLLPPKRRAKQKVELNASGTDVQTRACLNCNSVPVPNRRALFCSERCRQIAEWVRYARRKTAEGIIDRPDIQEAVTSRLSVLIRGFYDKRGERFVSDAERQELRSRGRCQKCGTDFTQDGDRKFTVQHIRIDDGFSVEAWCYRCNMEHAQSAIVVLSESESEFVQKCFDRVHAEKPLLPCDDEVNWPTQWRSLAGS